MWTVTLKQIYYNYPGDQTSNVDILIIRQFLKIRVIKQAQTRALPLLIKISFPKHLFNPQHTQWEPHGAVVFSELDFNFIQA